MLRRLVGRPTVAIVGAILMLAMPATALGSPTTAGTVPPTTSSMGTAPPTTVQPMQPGPTTTEAKTISREEALTIVKRYFTLPGAPGQVDLYLSTESGRPVWQLQYRVQQAYGSMGSSLGTVDAVTGKVLSFGSYLPGLRPLRTGPLGEPYPEEQARSKAWSLVQAMYPGDATELRAGPDGIGAMGGLRHGTYTFIWTPYHNDVPVLGEVATVTIDRYTGDYLSWNSGNHAELRFPEAPPTVTAEEATIRLKDAVTPTLVYQSEYGSQGTPSDKPRLVYRVDQPVSIDAISGQLIDESGQPVAGPGIPEAVPTATSTPVSPQTLPLTPDSAIAFVRQALALPADAQLEVVPAHATPDGHGIVVQWFDQDEGVGVILDPTTGRILQAFRDSSYPDVEEVAPPTAEQKRAASEAAIAVVQQYYANLIPDLMLMPMQPWDYGYAGQMSFHFGRFHQGVAVDGQGVDVSINLSDMTWLQFDIQWRETEFPSAEGCISVDEAKRLYLSGKEATLLYRPAFSAYRPGNELAPLDLMLVYELMPGDGVASAAMIDARKGIPIDGYGKPLPQPEATEAILGKHWAGGELLAMLDLNAIRQLDPDAPVNREDALQLLYKGTLQFSHGSDTVDLRYVDVPEGSNLAGLVQFGISHGVLNPVGEKPALNPERPITRAEFALWIARYLGFGSLARSDLQAVTRFTDLTSLTAEERNAVVLLEALRIVKTSERFRGDQPLTQAEGAAIMVRVLQMERSH